MKKYRDLWNGSLVRAIELLLDMIVIFFSFFVIAEVNHIIEEGAFIGPIELVAFYDGNWVYVLIYALVSLIFFVVYRPTITTQQYSKAIGSVALSILLTNLTLVVLSFMEKSEFLLGGKENILFVFLIQLLIFIVYKYITFIIVRKHNRREVVIVGPRQEALDLASALLRDTGINKKIKYVVFEDEHKRVPNALFNYINEVNDVYLTAGLKEQIKNKIINYVLLDTYKEIYMVPKTYEIGMLKSIQTQVDDTLVFRMKSMHLSFEQRFMKRAFDILVSTTGLIIAFIPMLIIALAIKLEDGGPVFYKQERMKRNNKIFKVLKFRSMKVHNEDENEKIASVNDNRITKVGKVIRMLRVDELPQLLNIFKGEMSLVGPRPLMLSVIEQTLKDHPEFRYRSNVKPGLTGLAQISSRYDTKDNEKLRYDLHYIRNYSFWYDLKIILLTVKTVLTKEQSVGREFNETFEDKVSNGSIVTEAIPSGYKIISK